MGRRFFILCLSIFLVFACSVSAQTLSLGLSSASASAGASVSLNLSLNAPAGSEPAGLQWTVNVPPQILSTAAVIGPAAAAAGKSLTCNLATCLITGMNRNVIANGVVAVITMAVAPSASGNLGAQLSGAVAATVDGGGASLTTSGGLVSVSPADSTSVTVSPTNITLSASQTQQFTAAATGTTDTRVTWSLAPQVGSISATGLYTAPGNIGAAPSPQTVTITATSANGTTGTATVFLTPPPPSNPVTLTLGPGNVTLLGAQVQGFTATLTGASNSSLVWSLSPALGSISNGGAYTAPAAISSPATVTVTVKSVADPSKSASAVVNLQPNPPVTPASAALTAGNTQQFAAPGATLWSVTPAVGSISATGLFTAPATAPNPQTLTVTATFPNGGTSTASVVLTATQRAPSLPLPIRVNAGGGAYTDPQGNVWSPDIGFSGGASYSTSSAVAGTNAPALYQSEHYSNGPFQYQFSVPNGTYTVNLKFAEIFFTSAGRRIFDVAINNQIVLPNFDPAQAGGAFTAVDRQFPVSVGNGQIVIQFTPVLDLPTISGIEILLPQTLPSDFTPIRVNAGGGAYTDWQGTVWSADTGFNTGSSYSNPHAIAGASNPTLYQKEHYANGPFQYQFAVPNGTYSVNLKFAEIYFSSGGRRIFNVALNGQMVLSNFDPAAVAGAFTAVDRQFPVTVTNGQILIQFTPVADMPTVSAIEILQQQRQQAIRVNAGGSAYTDSQGNVWSADVGFNTGSSYSDPRPVAGTSSPALYQSEHFSNGPFQYQFIVPNGTYSVNLKFAEIYFNSGGRRIFNVALNGRIVLANFDPAAIAGAFTAVDRRFPVTVTNGNIVIQFTPVADKPTVSAIEILPQTFTPIRVNAGGPAYRDPQGNVWNADNGFDTGLSYADSRPIAGTATPALYQTGHYAKGPFQYQASVPNGAYTVNLKFAELFFTSGGKRIFDVAINDQTVLPNFDPAQAAGAFTAVDRQFPVQVTNGRIAIKFTPVADLPAVSAIEIF